MRRCRLTQMRDNQEADQESGDSSSIAGTDNDRDEASGDWIVKLAHLRESASSADKKSGNRFPEPEPRDP